MLSKAWLAAPVLLAHAEGRVAENINIFFQWVQNLGTPRYSDTGTTTNWMVLLYFSYILVKAGAWYCVTISHRASFVSVVQRP